MKSDIQFASGMGLLFAEAPTPRQNTVITILHIQSEIKLQHTIDSES
jgi:hypothetical protein